MALMVAAQVGAGSCLGPLVGLDSSGRDIHMAEQDAPFTSQKANMEEEESGVPESPPGQAQRP